jgi:hypothetical protein
MASSDDPRIGHGDDTSREMALLEELVRLCSEDDFADGLGALDSYPGVGGSRPMTTFEREVRDWGFVYGMAFAMALREWPDRPRKSVAWTAQRLARMVYVRWAGDIFDPGDRAELGEVVAR